MLKLPLPTHLPGANCGMGCGGGKGGRGGYAHQGTVQLPLGCPKPSCYKSGTFYFYDGILVNNRYRITNTAARCGKLPVGKNVTGWVPASYCNGGGITTK